MTGWIEGAVVVCLLIGSTYSSRTYLGEGVTSCDSNELRDQLCPDTSNNQDRRYVRIKTFNGKYLFTIPSTTNNGYVVTRCCGKYPEDVKNPGQGSTFKIHCGTHGGKETVRFELLQWKNNNPSGWYFYAGNYNAIYAKKRPSLSDREPNFALRRWRGPVFAVESIYRRNWWSFIDERTGSISVRQRPITRYPEFPKFEDTFSIQLVPKECVDVRDNEKILASPASNSPDECEARADRCFWYIKDNNSPRCFYKKGSICFQPGSRNDCAVSASNAGECEAANCCYDYARNQCYAAKPIST